MAGGRQREEEAGGSAKPKTRTPHKDVGRNLRRPCACFFGFLHVHFVFNAAIFGLILLIRVLYWPVRPFGPG